MKKKKGAEKSQIVINTDQSKTNAENFIYRQVSFWLSIMGLAFGAFIYLSGPSRDNDTALQLQDQRISAQQKTIDGLNLTQQNDTKELKNEVAGLRTQMEAQTNEIVKLTTIIEERIPKK